jgi:hypothetical protein
MRGTMHALACPPRVQCPRRSSARRRRMPAAWPSRDRVPAARMERTQHFGDGALEGPDDARSVASSTDSPSGSAMCWRMACGARAHRAPVRRRDTCRGRAHRPPAGRRSGSRRCRRDRSRPARAPRRRESGPMVRAPFSTRSTELPPRPKLWMVGQREGGRRAASMSPVGELLHASCPAPPRYRWWCRPRPSQPPCPGRTAGRRRANLRGRRAGRSPRS